MPLSCESGELLTVMSNSHTTKTGTEKLWEDGRKVGGTVNRDWQRGSEERGRRMGGGHREREREGGRQRERERVDRESEPESVNQRHTERQRVQRDDRQRRGSRE